jgi:hypothetical protein
MATAPESAARAFLGGRESSASLVDLAVSTPSGSTDDQLIGVILAHGNTDFSTDAGLREALGDHFSAKT